MDDHGRAVVATYKVGDLVRKNRWCDGSPLFVVVASRQSSHFEPRQEVRLARCVDGLLSPWLHPHIGTYEVINESR